MWLPWSGLEAANHTVHTDENTDASSSIWRFISKAHEIGSAINRHQGANHKCRASVYDNKTSSSYQLHTVRGRAAVGWLQLSAASSTQCQFIIALLNNIVPVRDRLDCCTRVHNDSCTEPCEMVWLFALWTKIIGFFKRMRSKCRIDSIEDCGSILKLYKVQHFAVNHHKRSSCMG